MGQGTNPANVAALPIDERVEFFREIAQHLIDFAERHGVIITAVRESQQPPAMGHHVAVVTAYESHAHRTGVRP